MNLITDTWKGLVRRKLWPIALLLVGALVAVPLTLAKEPAVEPVAAVALTSKDDALPATFVAADEGRAAAKRRRVLGAAKDPFEPAGLSKKVKAMRAKAKAQADAAEQAAPDPADSGGSSSGSGATSEASGGGGTTAPPTSAAPTATPEPTVTVPAYSVKVRFGTTDSDDLKQSTIGRLSVLPDEHNPVMVYRGVEDGGKVAIFELTGDVVAEGDGTCAPTPEDCQYVKLRAGETEFITVSDVLTAEGEAAEAAQYQLDLVKIYKKDDEGEGRPPTRPRSRWPRPRPRRFRARALASSCGAATATSSTRRRARCTARPRAPRPRAQPCNPLAAGADEARAAGPRARRRSFGHEAAS